MTKKQMKEELEQKAKLLHPKCVLQKADPRCGERYAFTIMEGGLILAHVSGFYPLEGLDAWFDAYMGHYGIKTTIENCK